MYHIKSDKRSQASAKNISDALLKLLEHKEFNNITISDVQRVSYVGRSTFYRLYDNLSDVLAYLCDQTFDKILEYHHTLEAQKTEEIFIFFIGQWMENEVLLKAIIDSNHIDLLYRSFRDRSDETEKLFFSSKPVDTKHMDYLISIAATAMIGGLSTWIKNKKSESAEEVYYMVRKSTEIFYHITK